MNKKSISSKVASKIDEAALAALEAGKGQRTYGGGTSGISVGDEYKILGVTYATGLMPKKDVDDKDWRNMDEEERVANGVERSWFAFTTNNGTLAFTAVCGEKDMYSEEYWKDVQTKADDFDVAKLFRPSARTAEAWTLNDYDDLIGSTIRCVAAKEYTPTGQTFTIKVRAWVITEGPALKA